MSKYEKSARFDEREVRDSRKDRHERPDKDRDTRRRRRHRSPSYDSYSDSDDSYYSDRSRGPSPRRPTRRHTTVAQPHAHSDGEERGYRKSRGRDRRGHDSDYYSDRSPSRSRERSREREKGNIVEDLLAAIGLLQSKHKDGNSRSATVGPEDEARKKKTREALQAALTAAAMEAFRTRKDGKITPQRLMQIAGAAIAAGGLDVLVEKAGSLGNSRGGGDSGSMRSIIESVVSSLATSKTLGGKGGKHGTRGEESLGAKIGSGVVNMAAKHLARSLSQGPTRRKTARY
ncbi:uncharacterized protein DFL_001356 [Arthrobotrys flagrans]|uniref:Uncharacterized protein n=1 Tax=Arthrobotrys flagrans TaxID=97331 RepID=A0A437AGZ3_ARTFL|nr:hypothetical protein DFL_001356 [Arthrobotrys flagrans]